MRERRVPRRGPSGSHRPPPTATAEYGLLFACGAIRQRHDSTRARTVGCAPVQMVSLHEASLVSVNVGQSRTVSWRGRAVRTAIWKRPVATPVHVGRLNVAGDAQARLDEPRMPALLTGHQAPLFSQLKLLAGKVPQRVSDGLETSRAEPLAGWFIDSRV